jgi:DNA gyrase subunit B
MNAEELWETTMNPENRVLKRVTVEDAIGADKVFDILMGTDVSSRKSFIQSNAKMANLDI